MGKLRERISDPALLKLIHRYQKAGKIVLKFVRNVRQNEKKEMEECYKAGHGALCWPRYCCMNQITVAPWSITLRPVGTDLNRACENSG